MSDKNWQDEYSKRIEAMHNKVKHALRDEEQFVYYSVYPTKNDLPIDNIDDVAFEGKGILVAEKDSFWGDGERYESEVVENPTWVQISVLANAMIKTTGDYHHNFLEGIQRTEKTKDGITIFEFAMGS